MAARQHQDRFDTQTISSETESYYTAIDNGNIASQESLHQSYSSPEQTPRTSIGARSNIAPSWRSRTTVVDTESHRSLFFAGQTSPSRRGPQQRSARTAVATTPPRVPRQPASFNHLHTQPTPLRNVLPAPCGAGPILRFEPDRLAPTIRSSEASISGSAAPSPHRTSRRRPRVDLEEARKRNRETLEAQRPPSPTGDARDYARGYVCKPPPYSDGDWRPEGNNWQPERGSLVGEAARISDERRQARRMRQEDCGVHDATAWRDRPGQRDPEERRLDGEKRDGDWWEGVLDRVRQVFCMAE